MYSDTGTANDQLPTASPSRQDGSLPPASDVLLLDGSSPRWHSSRPAPSGDHCRRVSWDDTTLETAAGAAAFDRGQIAIALRTGSVSADSCAMLHSMPAT